MKYNITIFEAECRGKVPASPFGDKTFIFRTREASTNFEFLSTIGKHFIMNQPFKDAGSEHDFRDYRRISTLKNKFQESFEYIILDIDDLTTKSDMEEVLKYFKDYKVILGESYSHNGIDNFRLKGVLFCEEMNAQELQESLRHISNDLKAYCTVDTSRGHIPSFNAPAKKVKVILNNEHGTLWKPTLSNLTVLPRLSKKEINELKKSEPKHRIHNTYESAQSVEELCLMYFENLGFEAVKPYNDAIMFKHSSEVKTPGGFAWFKDNPYRMQHWNEERTVDIFSAVNQVPRMRELVKESLNYDSELLSYNPRTNLIKVHERFLEVTPEIQEHIESFIENDLGVFSIRSGMGTGKSTIIKEIIDCALDYGQRVLIITNRISVAQDFQEKYNLKIYNNQENKYNLGDSLICQFDSLWKYDIQEFDLVIMDEFISLMLHSRSDLGNSTLNVIKFFGAFNKKLVIADAFLTGYERFLLPKKVDDNSYLLDNEYRDNTVLYDYSCKNEFVLRLLHTAREHKITVSSTSLGFLSDVRSLLQANGLRTMSLTASTPEHTKELIYETFKENHDKYDVLLFSPTLTVGVSNLNDIRYHFHFDGSQSADVISSLQMIKRTRKASEIHVFVQDTFKHLETNYQKLRTKYLDNVGKQGDFSILFEINEYGDVQVSETGKKVLKIDIFNNILESNHRGAFMWMLKYHFLNEPRKVTKKFNANILSSYTKANRQNSKEEEHQIVKEFTDFVGVELNDQDPTIRKIADIHEALNLHKIEHSGIPELKETILKCALDRGSFIRECRHFNLFRGYLIGYYSKEDIRYRMQNFISNSDIPMTNFCSVLLKVVVPYSEEYEMKDLRIKHFSSILDKSGYERASSLGRRYMKIRSDVLEFAEYIME